jgi:ribosomal protein L22
VSSTLEAQTVRAQAKWVRTSARKARVVAEHIRGRSVPEARAVLAFTQRAAARDLEKVLSSAVANAESRPDLHWHGDDLVVVSVTVDEGPTLKRWRARARGRVARIKKRTCHITVLLAPMAQGPAVAEAPKRAAKAPEAMEAKPKPKRPAAKRAAKPKSKSMSEPSATASARAKRARKES